MFFCCFPDVGNYPGNYQLLKLFPGLVDRGRLVDYFAARRFGTTFGGRKIVQRDGAEDCLFLYSEESSAVSTSLNNLFDYSRWIPEVGTKRLAPKAIDHDSQA